MAEQNLPQQGSPSTGEAQKLSPPPRPRQPGSYEMLKKTDPTHRLVVEYESAVKAWDEWWHINNPPAIVRRPEPLKKLKEVDVVSAYNLFRHYYLKTTGNEFDPDVNNGEGKKLAYSLLYYIFCDKRFFDSPLLNKDFAETNFRKGIAVVGGYGCGKTSIFRSIRAMFFEASRNPDIVVKDIDGDNVSLGRYRRLFGYYSANEVVRIYEEAATPEQRDRFWKIFTGGKIYFDDLMTERQASNYGKVELFKDILEGRYEKSVPTMISLNYDGTLQETILKIKDRYGPRVFDRLYEMFNIIELQGSSLRK